MKTKLEIENMKKEIAEKISIIGDKARSQAFGSAEYDMYDREYAKLTAQYNILLEVLK